MIVKMKSKVRFSSWVLLLLPVISLFWLSLKAEKSTTRAKRACGSQVESYVMRPNAWTGFRPRAMPRKIIWGMLFDCEEWLLEIKLNEVGHLVDHFILVEGLYSLQNRRRQQCFPRIASANPRISKWLPKIVYIYDTQYIQGFQYWEAEVYYRNLIGLQGLRQLSLRDDDLMVVSDVDELLSAPFLHFLKWNEGFPTLIKVRLLWSYYAFYWVNPNLFQKGMVASIKELSDLGQNRTNAIRFNLLGGAQAWSPVAIAGWHAAGAYPQRPFSPKCKTLLTPSSTHGITQAYRFSPPCVSMAYGSLISNPTHASSRGLSSLVTCKPTCIDFINSPSSCNSRVSISSTHPDHVIHVYRFHQFTVIM